MKADFTETKRNTISGEIKNIFCVISTPEYKNALSARPLNCARTQRARVNYGIAEVHMYTGEFNGSFTWMFMLCHSHTTSAYVNTFGCLPEIFMPR